MIRNQNKAMVLVTVLWVSVLLVILVASLGRTQRVDTKVGVYTTQQRRCAWVARAGFETALAILAQDSAASDSLDELWSDNAEGFNNVSLGSCVFTVTVTDESSKLNVNHATRDQLLGLHELEPEVADSILDWRDKDDDPREEGAESGYYEQQVYGYRSRNAPFRTVRELLLVKGVSEERFFGEDTNWNNTLDENEQDGDERPPLDDGDSDLDKGWMAYLTCYTYSNNTDAQGQTRLNVNDAEKNVLEETLGLSSGQAQWIVDNRKDGFDSIGDLIEDDSPKTSSDRPGNNSEAQRLDQQTYRQIVDKICVNGETVQPGRVNVNTAPRAVLVALFGGEGKGDALAENLLTYRAGQTLGMSSIGDLLDVSGMNIKQFKKIADRVTVRSQVFSIRCVARASNTAVSGAVAHYEAVVDRSKSPAEILYSYQGAGYE